MRIIILGLLLLSTVTSAQQNLLAPTPPMGWMTWNYFGTDIHKDDLCEMADAIVESGMTDLGYTYIYIDDGWVGGRDKRNNITPDPEKFPPGMKALADLHEYAGPCKWNVFVKPLSDCDYAVAMLNLSDVPQNFRIKFQEIGLPDKYEIRDLWEHKVIGTAKKWQ